MAFSNPIVGGNGVLKRVAIQSPDYVPGVSGWAIMRDGTAEFNSLTARGSMQSGNYVPGVSGWKIDEAGDVEINDGTFRGDLNMTDAGSGASLFTTVGTNFTEFNFTPYDFPPDPSMSPTLSGYIAQSVFLDLALKRAQPYLHMSTAAVANLEAASILLTAQGVENGTIFRESRVDIDAQNIVLGGVNGITQARQTIGQVNDFTTVAGGAATEAVVMSVDASCIGGRAYEVKHTGRFTVSVGGTAPIFRFRKGLTTAGTLLGLPGRKPSSATAGAEMDAECSAIFICNADTSDSVSLTTTTGSAATMTSTGGFAGRTLRVTDIGPSINWPGMPAIG